MLTSLIFGTEALVQEKINGKVVINQVEAYREKGLFKIGHEMVSETFMPCYFYDKDNKIIYADIAGLEDNRGNLMEFVNKFVTKSLFMKAKKVKFMVPMTKAQFSNTRGVSVREQIRFLHSLCEGNIIEFSLSIKTILTKCKVTSAENDIEALQGTFH